jgi:hypothetical protein
MWAYFPLSMSPPLLRHWIQGVSTIPNTWINECLGSYVLLIWKYIMSINNFLYEFRCPMDRKQVDMEKLRKLFASEVRGRQKPNFSKFQASPSAPLEDVE